jgi:hypothetical protein
VDGGHVVVVVVCQFSTFSSYRRCWGTDHRPRWPCQVRGAA